MAHITKYNAGIVGVVKHNVREFRDGKCPTNLEVDPARSCENYSVIRRGRTAKEIERYRKSVDKECFQYHRKNLVHAVETVFTLPKDCPPEQERSFFDESLKFLCSTLPMGERCVFLAEVHADEGRVVKGGQIVADGAKHMHVMYVPAVMDEKHEGYDFRLCADELTKRAKLKEFHPAYQKWLDDAGIHATVASGVTSGRGVSVKALKEISKETGLSLEQIKSLEHDVEHLRAELIEKGNSISRLDERLAELETENHALQMEQSRERTWGDDGSWGSDSDWGSTKEFEMEDEKLW